MSTNGGQIVLPELGRRQANKLIDYGFILERLPGLFLLS